MTRDISAEVYSALQQRTLVARDFLWLEVKDRTTGAPVTDGYWSDVGSTTVNVIDPETGGISNRTFFGAGSLVQISDIPLISNLTVQNVIITLSPEDDRSNDLIRTYECKFGKVQVFRGLYDPLTRVMVAPAMPRFVGFIDNIQITTPKENADNAATVLTCTSHTQELTRSNSDTRSDASQQLRAPGDGFYADVSVVGEWQMFWGKASGVVPAAPSGLAATLNAAIK